MNRTTNGKGKKADTQISAFTQVITDILSRQGLARRLGYQYGDKRKIYKALGYPEEKDLTFEYFFNQYDRNPIAAAVVDRPTDKVWGQFSIVEKGKKATESELNNQWRELNKRLKVIPRLTKVDKLCQIGKYSLLLFGFDDVKRPEEFTKPVTGKRNLLYLRQVAESEVTIDAWETNTSNERYGKPLLYRIKIGTVSETTAVKAAGSHQEIKVHHSRVIHVVHDNLTSEVEGTPILKPIINRLIDLEKILGGDAEMFWRGARPGYTATNKEGYELDETARTALYEELDKYEHDLRRFITANGVDIDALETQIADPLNHVDAQLQAISAETGIPKRILVGSERGELASSQDQDQFLSLIKERQDEFAEPELVVPFVNKCMEYGILPKADYEVMWEDVFAPSEYDRVEIGTKRANALKAYSDSAMASEILTPELAFRHLLGMNEEQVQEALKAMEKLSLELEREEEDARLEEEETEEDNLIEEEENES